ncbi:MAG: hypothetical protein ACRD96_17925 [Bryobacteraceae bacterium]
MTDDRLVSLRAPIVPERIRAIGKRGFAFIPNRFLHDGFFAQLTPDERALYFFLVIAGNRSGVSFYQYDSICALLNMPLELYIEARNGLIEKDLIAFDGSRFQVLELPDRPTTRLLRNADDLERHDRAAVRATILRSLASDDSDT